MSLTRRESEKERKKTRIETRDCASCNISVMCRNQIRSQKRFRLPNKTQTTTTKNKQFNPNNNTNKILTYQSRMFMLYERLARSE